MELCLFVFRSVDSELLINFSSLLYTGTVVSAHLVPRQGCSVWCTTNFSGQKAQQCISQAAKGTGPCYECGPEEPPPHQSILCSGKCINVQTSPKNCGSCGHVVRLPYSKSLWQLQYLSLPGHSVLKDNLRVALAIAWIRIPILVTAERVDILYVFFT